jgi:predicted RNase H-like HicB family nuclease
MGKKHYKAKVKIEVQVVIEPDESKFYGYSPDMKGLHMDGSTEMETLGNVQDAIEVYLRSVFKGAGLKFKKIKVSL